MNEEGIIPNINEREAYQYIALGVSLNQHIPVIIVKARYKG